MPRRVGSYCNSSIFVVVVVIVAAVVVVVVVAAAAAAGEEAGVSSAIVVREEKRCRRRGTHYGIQEPEEEQAERIFATIQGCLLPLSASLKPLMPKPLRRCDTRFWLPASTGRTAQPRRHSGHRNLSNTEPPLGPRSG